MPFSITHTATNSKDNAKLYGGTFSIALEHNFVQAAFKTSQGLSII